MDLVRELRKTPQGMVALHSVWEYLLTMMTLFGPEQWMERLVDVVDEEGKDEIKSVAEHLIERGLKQGQRRILLKQLRTRFGMLPDGVAETVNAADPAQLELWAERVLTAPTLSDVSVNVPPTAMA